MYLSEKKLAWGTPNEKSKNVHMFYEIRPASDCLSTVRKRDFGDRLKDSGRYDHFYKLNVLYIPFSEVTHTSIQEKIKGRKATSISSRHVIKRFPPSGLKLNSAFSDLQVACFNSPEKLSPCHTGIFKRLSSFWTRIIFSGPDR